MIPTPDPHLFVVLGATGDLARKKLLPAIARLNRHLGAQWRIVGVARATDLDDAAYRAWARQALAEAELSADDRARWNDEQLHYVGLGAGGADDWARVAARIAEVEAAAGLPGHRAFYLALPSDAFAPTLEGLGGAGLHRADGWTRLVVEKPFGSDLASARALNATVHRWFAESQVFRIDHYLGKETVQNLLVFRFANAIFESLWNRERIECVQVTVAEEVGIGGRGATYERAGALRDMVQNHLTQLASLVAMEVPGAYDADAVRFEKIKALRAVQPIDPARVVLGQYTAGSVAGRAAPGYREEERVDRESPVETFAALELAFDTWRWQGVPFYLRTGKRLPRRVTEIAVVFRRPPVALFRSLDCARVDANVLLINLQPNEGFSLLFGVKRPGEPLALEMLPLHFDYAQTFGEPPEAYETLLLDVVTGDQTLFVHAEEVEASWRLYEPLLDGALPVLPYPAGSWGPTAAGRLPGARGHHWWTT